MPFSFLKYPLSKGFIDHWLTAGPFEIPGSSAKDSDQAAIPTLLSPGTGLDVSSVEQGLLGAANALYPLPAWRYLYVREDHFVNFTPGDLSPGCFGGYCAVILTSPTTQNVSLSLTFCGLATLWLNSRFLIQAGNLSQADLKFVSVPVELHPGNNMLIARLHFTGARGIMNIVALKVDGPEISSIGSVLPTEIEPEYIQKRMKLEGVVEAAFLDRYVYGYLDGDRFSRNESIPLRFEERLPISAEITFRLQSLSDDIFQEGTNLVDRSSVLEMARNYPLRSGPHHLVLLPPAGLYYEKKLRFERKELFYIARSPFAQAAAPSRLKERVKLTLKDAAERRSDSLFSEIAKMALKNWDIVDAKILQAASARVIQRPDGSLEVSLGFLGMLLRYGKKRSFPKGLKPILSGSVRGYCDHTDEFRSDEQDFWSESRQILFYACEILAGQLFPDLVFKNSGKTGQEHRQRGEQLAIEWMRARGQFGFREWDSPSTIEAVVSALTHLVDLAECELICELAAVLLDKIFFDLAANSFQGAYATSRGASTTSGLLSARLEETSGIARLLWGLGTFNDAVMGTVSLACCQKYRLPDLIARIATASPASSWSRAQNCQPFTTGGEPSTSAWRVNKVSYRTADYMLSSAQNYYPGQKGRVEHIWQAALGPDALVFTNHPTSMSEEETQSPNLWRGNGVLPDVAQWGDVLFAIYHLPDDDWMAFTHAYFPAAAFDETHFEEGWAFARKGSGYLALSACHPFEFITRGQTAYRELRSTAIHNTWICHMGQELLDGSFEMFRLKILQMELRLNDQSVEMSSLRGDRLAFSWQGPLVVNGIAQPQDGYPHIENLYAFAPLSAAEINILDSKSGIHLKFD